MKINVKCGWCHKEFETDNTRDSKTESYGTRVCPHCGRLVKASRIESTENLVGKKHFHSPSKTGDVV